MSSLRKFDETHQQRFCDALRVHANFGKAAAACGFSRTVVKNHIANNPEFAAAVEEATDDAIDLVEEQIRKRAIDGVQEPVFYQGAKCGEVTKHSDTLLMFLAKKLSPAFREKTTVDLNVNDDVAKKILEARQRAPASGG